MYEITSYTATVSVQDLVWHIALGQHGYGSVAAFMMQTGVGHDKTPVSSCTMPNQQCLTSTQCKVCAFPLLFAVSRQASWTSVFYNPK